MKTVLFSSSRFGQRCAGALLEAGHEVCGIVTLPRTFRISYAPQGVTNVQHADLHAFGKEQGIEVYTLDGDMRDPGLRPRLERWGGDVGLAAGWYHLIPASVRSQFPRGVVGIHASLLPKYRGGAPLVWAMIEGERTTGVSLFYFDDGVDTGDLIDQRSFPIHDTDTIADVLERATAASEEMLVGVYPALAAGTAPRRAQDHEQAAVYPQRSPADGRIDWTWSAERIDRFIRAQTRPYPGAFTEVGGKRVTIWSATVEDAAQG